MYGELYQYLILHKQLSMPGIGTFLLERKPAYIDFVNKIAEPPAYTIALHHGNVPASKNVFDWLASKLEISELDAVKRFNDFSFDIKNKVLAGDRLLWEGVGEFSKGMAGEIRFEAVLKDKKAGVPIPAVKVIRENAEHTMMVGEDEKTSSQMKEILSPSHERKFQWWGIALIVSLLAFIFIGVYLSTKGVKTSSVGNQQQLTPQKASPTYQPKP